MLPKGNRRQAMHPDLSCKWAQAAHVMFLDSLMREVEWTPDEMAFHGGTNLHLSWNSPRYSEDLDFLLSREAKNVARVVTNATKHVQTRFRRFDPQFSVQVKDRTKDEDRMQVFALTISHPRVVGSTMVKAEFWKAEAIYLQNYPTEFKTPIASGDLAGSISYPVPAAKLSTAYADKLVAFATRPHLKWRDIFDLWWIGTQTNTVMDRGRLCDQFLMNIQAYTPLKGLAPHKALLEFINIDRDYIIKKADPDLKNWLPDALWKVLHPKGVEQMVDFVRVELLDIHNQIEANENCETLSDVSADNIGCMEIPE